jgi:hypothetical protein
MLVAILLLSLTSVELAPAAVVPSPPFATAVLALKSGRAMEVRVYALEGPLAKIVGLDGGPLVMRAELVDVVRSEQLTAKNCG